MTTKIAPATPLADASERDQIELIRRSRAYPQLVEFLRAVYGPQSMEARALLRELGEL